MHHSLSRSESRPSFLPLFGANPCNKIKKTAEKALPILSQKNKQKVPLRMYALRK